MGRRGSRGGARERGYKCERTRLCQQAPQAVKTAAECVQTSPESKGWAVPYWKRPIGECGSKDGVGREKDDEEGNCSRRTKLAEKEDVGRPGK